MDTKPLNPTSEEFLGTMRMYLAQALGFRRITLLLLQGVADSDPERFVREVKLISHQAAEMGA